jgi:hypothetical protein
MPEKKIVREVTIAGQAFVLRSGDVVRALRNVEPEPITSHFVVVGSRRYPPKQIISAMTGLDRADFTTHQARRTLMRLGFPAGRRGARGLAHRSGASAYLVPDASIPPQERLSDRLRPLVGQWVAIKDEDVIHAAQSPQALVGWLAQHGQKADSVFRVPDDDRAATGLAPL